MPEMLDFVDCWDKEKEARAKINPKNICTFGIKPLDDAFTGILPNDLIVIGADSGLGKSQLCLDIALHNALNAKKVALYFIEGGAEEAMARIKWKLMCNVYYEKYKTGVEMDYRKWRMNLIENKEFIHKLEIEALQQYAIKLEGYLYLYSFEKGFTIADLTNSLSWFLTKESFIIHPEQPMFDIDLIIIDHLQYFTLTDPKNELKEMSDILVKVKEITNFDNIPVILVSHLRKKDKERGLPSQEDFYGTSNIAKISSASITISSASDKTDFSDGLFPTFFRIVKSRVKIPSNLALLCNFDIKTQKYSEEYDVFRLVMDKPANEPLLNHHKPNWAKKAYDKNRTIKPVRTFGERDSEDTVLSPSLQHSKQSSGNSEHKTINPEEIEWQC